MSLFTEISQAIGFEGRLRASLATGLRAHTPYSAPRRSAQNGAVSLKILLDVVPERLGDAAGTKSPEGAITAVDSRRRDLLE